MDLYLQLAVSGLLIGGIYALISVGLTLVFGVLRVVNFAHGEYLMLAMYGCYWLFHLWGLDPFVSALIVVPGAFVLGLVTDWLLIRRTLDAPHVVQVFVTFALSIWLQNLALMMFSSDFRAVRVDYASAVFEVGPLLISVSRLAAFAVAILSAVLLTEFLRRSYLGKAIRATAQDRRSARLMGINVDRIYRHTFAMGCALVALAGVLLAPLYPVNPFKGADMILIAFVIVVLGGMGSIGGAVVAGVLLGVIEAISGFVFGAEMKQIVYFVFFIGVLAIRPTGLFGKRGAEVMEVT